MTTSISIDLHPIDCYNLRDVTKHQGNLPVLESNCKACFRWTDQTMKDRADDHADSQLHERIVRSLYNLFARVSSSLPVDTVSMALALRLGPIEYVRGASFTARNSYASERVPKDQFQRRGNDETRRVVAELVRSARSAIADRGVRAGCDCPAGACRRAWREWRRDPPSRPSP